MLQQFLQEFGYFALFLGTFFEGETILVLAGFLAFRGYMDLKLVMIVAFLGSYAGDQLWYFLGRKHGRKLLARKPRWQLMGDKALEHIRKHPDIWVLSFRFVYGLRTVMPVAIGLSGYPPGRYLLLIEGYPSNFANQTFSFVVASATQPLESGRSAVVPGDVAASELAARIMSRSPEDS